MPERGLVSFPKAGRTWVRLFLHYYWMLTGMDWQDMSVTFTHGRGKHGEQNRAWEFERRVLLVRHPCDVMVSYWLHRTVRGKTETNVSQFIRGRRRGVSAYNWAHERWAERTEGQLVVRYEDLFGPGPWREMLAFWGVPVVEDAFEDAWAKCEFDTVRANLGEIAGFPSAWRYLAAEHGRYGVVEPKNPEAHKFRRGVVGGYVDYLGQDDIDYILGNFTLGESLEPLRLRYLEESEQWNSRTP